MEGCSYCGEDYETEEDEIPACPYCGMEEDDASLS